MGAAVVASALGLSATDAYAAAPKDQKDIAEPKKETRKSKRAARKNQEPPPIGELSSGGTDRAGLEITLGVVTLGVVASLGLVGSFAIVTGMNRRHQCQFQLTTDCDLVTVESDFAAAGLSFGLMVPLTAAGALLLRKATRIRSDYEAFHAQQTAFALGVSRRSFNVSWTLRF